MKFVQKFCIFFTIVIITTLFLTQQPANVDCKKKKYLAALLIGALLGSKQKMMPLPLPLPIPLPIKHEKVIPYPEPYHYPVYTHGGGYEHGSYGGGGGGDHYAAASGHMPQYALPPQGYRPY